MPDVEKESPDQTTKGRWLGFWQALIQLGTVVGLIITGVGLIIAYATFHHEQTKTEFEIHDRQESLDLQRMQLAASVVQFMTCENGPQRAAALAVLRLEKPRTDPSKEYIVPHRQEFLKILDEKCAKLATEDRQELRRLRDGADERVQEERFLGLLSAAREYLENGHEGPATSYFAAAAGQQIPKGYLVDSGALNRAKSALARNEFKEAADRFEAAFRGIPTP